MWSSSNLLDYMSKRPRFYGERWQHITDADHSYLAKCFTDSVLTHLDLSSIVALPFTEIKYEGKGDPCGVLIDPDYCFTDEQISAIMNFICTRDSCYTRCFCFDDYTSFRIEMYLTRSIPLSQNLISYIRNYLSASFDRGDYI